MGYNRERALTKASVIFNSVTQILDIAKDEGIPTQLAAERLAERRIAQIQALNNISVAPGRIPEAGSPIPYTCK